MEFLDVVNDRDEVIGKTSHSEIYEKKLPHRIVHVLIFNEEGKLALQLQSKNKKFCPNHWVSSAAGHVKSGETCKQAVLREMKEEIGIEVPVEFLAKNLYEKNELKKFISSFKATFNGPFQVNPGEVEKTEFFTMEEIQDMINQGEKIHPELLFLLKNHFGTV